MKLKPENIRYIKKKELTINRFLAMRNTKGRQYRKSSHRAATKSPKSMITKFTFQLYNLFLYFLSLFSLGLPNHLRVFLASRKNNEKFMYNPFRFIINTEIERRASSVEQGKKGKGTG